MAERSAGRPPRGLAGAGLVAGSLALSLGAAEGIVRVLDLAPPAKRLLLEGRGASYRPSGNPVLAYELRPGLRGEGGTLVTNSLGQRDVERDTRKAAGVRRVLLLGDSVVEGDGIDELDDTISRQWERLDPTGSTEVLNFGVSGYCTRSEVELFATKGLPLAPDDAVLVFVENDFDCFSRRHLELGVPRPRAVNALFSRSSLFRLVCLRLDLWGFATEGDPLRSRGGVPDPDGVAESLDRWARLCAEHGVRPLVAIWPRFLEDRIVDVHFMPGSDELIVESLAAAAGVPAVRLSAYFERERRAAPGNPRRDYTVGDGLHPSARGAGVAAAALREILATDRRPERKTAGGEVAEVAREAARRQQRAQAHANRGDALRAAGRAAEAIGEYRRALEIDPARADWRTTLATLLADSGADPAAGLEVFREAAETDDTASAHFNLGLALDRHGDGEGARVHYERAVELDPEYLEARLNLGILLAGSGRAHEAVEHFVRAVETDPGSARALSNLGLVLTDTGRAPEALPFLRRAVELDPAYADAHENLGIALVRSGRPAEAVEALLAAGRLDPERLAARVGAVWLLATVPGGSAEDRRRAVEIARSLVAEGHDRQPSVLDALAVAYASQGRFREARVAATTALAECDAADGSPDADLCAAIRTRLSGYESAETAGPGRPVSR